MNTLPVKIKIEDLEPAKNRMLEMGFSPAKFVKEAGFVAQIWNDPKNSYLRNATKESLLSAVISIAQTGLTLNPVAKQAYLIPRKTKSDGNYIVQSHLEPSYIGLVKLLTDAGQVINLQTNLVYDGDDFDVSLGMETTISHKPYYINGKNKGKIKGVYVVANLKTGQKQFEYMTTEEIHEIRATSESYKASQNNSNIPCIWNTYEGEMFRKTCIKRIAKHLPRSEQFDYANELTNTDFEMSLNQLSMIESLLETSNIISYEREQIEVKLSSMTHSDAQKTIEYLRQNQQTPGIDRNITSMSDVNNLVDQKMNDDKA